MDRLVEVGLEKAAAKLPSEISGGMRKRAGFARALVLDPDIVLFDEPDSGLDPVRTSLLNDVILDMHERHKGTYLVVTHDIRTARKVSDYVGVIWKGKAVHYSEAEAAFNSSGPVRAPVPVGRLRRPPGDGLMGRRIAVPVSACWSSRGRAARGLLRDAGLPGHAVLPNAGNLFVGGSVMRDGYEAGSITDIKVEDGKAVVELSLDDEFAPLHDGATVEVVWKAALGERLLRVEDGPESNAGARRRRDARRRTARAGRAGRRALRARRADPRAGRVAGQPAARHPGPAARRTPTRACEPPGRRCASSVRCCARSNTDGEAIKQIVAQFDETMRIVAERDQSLQQVVTSLAAMTELGREPGGTARRDPGEAARRCCERRAPARSDRVPGTVDADAAAARGAGPGHGAPATGLEEPAPAAAGPAADRRPAATDARRAVAAARHHAWAARGRASRRSPTPTGR